MQPRMNSSSAVRFSLLMSLSALVAAGVASRAGVTGRQAANSSGAPVHLTAEQDHQRIMDLLHITSLRPGADGRDPKAPNAANYDESKANPYPNLPDPLVLKNGKRVDDGEGVVGAAAAGNRRGL